MFEHMAQEYNVPMITSPKALCTDNASMIAWTGWELINAQQDVDIRGKKMNGLKKLPLGSYVEGLINMKEGAQERITTMRH